MATRLTEERLYLFREATKRGITIEQLREELIHCIASDRLCSAVLDDEKEKEQEHA
jgi:hypothetical protein